MRKGLSPPEGRTDYGYRFWVDFVKDIEQVVLLVSNLRDRVSNGAFSLRHSLFRALCKMLDHLGSNLKLVSIYSYIQAPTVVTSWMVTQDPNQILGLVWLWEPFKAGQSERFRKQG